MVLQCVMGLNKTLIPRFNAQPESCLSFIASTNRGNPGTTSSPLIYATFPAPRCSPGRGPALLASNDCQRKLLHNFRATSNTISLPIQPLFFSGPPKSGGGQNDRSIGPERSIVKLICKSYSTTQLVYLHF